jgi:hypothetical protein
MKNLLIVLISMLAIIISGCRKETKDFVIIGQIYYTWGHANQERLKGKVKELRQTHYWVKEENGKIVKGDPITAEDRKTTPIGNDFTEEYNQLGIVTKNTTFVDSKTTQVVTVESEGKIIIKTIYELNGVVSGYGKYKYEGERPVFLQVYNQATDTLISNFIYEYDSSGRIVKFRTMNYRNEPRNYFTKTWDEKGNLLSQKTFNKEDKLLYQLDFTFDVKGIRVSHHEQFFTNNRLIDYTYKYEYDKMGNQTAIINMKDGKPFIYRAREIEYYD